MRCVKTANLKFTQLCPKQAHIDYMPVADTSRAQGPRCDLSQMYIQYVHTHTHRHARSTQHICTISHTLIISVCSTVKEVGPLPAQQDKHLQKCVTQVVNPWTLSVSSRPQHTCTKSHLLKYLKCWNIIFSFCWSLFHVSSKYTHSLLIKLVDSGWLIYSICAFSHAKWSQNIRWGRQCWPDSTHPLPPSPPAFSTIFLAFIVYTFISCLTVRATLLCSSAGFLLLSLTCANVPFQSGGVTDIALLSLIMHFPDLVHCYRCGITFPSF